MSEKLTGGEAVLRSVLRHGVDTIFGLPGVQTYPLFDALARHGNAIRTLGVRHEQRQQQVIVDSFLFFFCLRGGEPRHVISRARGVLGRRFEAFTKRKSNCLVRRCAGTNGRRGARELART